MPKSIDELDGILCDYCRLPQHKRKKLVDDGVYCFDSGRCEKAYQSYLNTVEDEDEEV